MIEIIRSIAIWVISIIAAEAMTEIITKSDILFPIRKFMDRINPKFLGKLINCSYCTSVWVAMTIAWVLPGTVFNDIIFDIAIKTLCLHRLSNLFHKLTTDGINLIIHNVKMDYIEEINHGQEVD